MFPLKRCVLLFLVFVQYNAIAQLIVEDSLNLKRGIYATFEEMKYNKPSIIVDFEVKSRVRGFGSYTTYEIKIKGKKTSPMNLWGFCDGKDVYINGVPLNNKMLYDKVYLMGEYNYFERFNNGHLGTTTKPLISLDYSSPTLNDIMEINLPEKKGMFLSISDGKVIDISFQSVEVILKKDAEIYQEYSNDPDKRKNYLKYIDKYNKKHFAELK